MSSKLSSCRACHRSEDAFAVAEGVWDVSADVKFKAGFRAYFEEATVVFDGAEIPSLCVYKKDGDVEVPRLHMEYDVESNEAGINISNLGPYYTEIKYFAECVRDGKDIEKAPLVEGAKSVDLAIREWEAAKKYLKKRFH